MNFLLLLFGYTLFDRIGYNLTRRPDWSSPWHWHGTKAVVHLLVNSVAIFHFPFFIESLTWQTALAFEICFWTFGLDWLYYATTIIPHRIKWLDAWQDTKRDFANGIEHAWWTVLGWIALACGAKKTDLAPVRWLVIQAVVGFIFALLILI